MSTIVTVPASLAWLTDPLDPGGQSVQCGTRRDGATTDAIDGEILVFAGDRSELVSYDTSNLTLPITFAYLSPAQFTQVRNWRGRTLLLRTIDGQRYYGGYLSIAQSTFYRGGPGGSGAWYEAGVSFLAATYSDTV